MNSKALTQAGAGKACVEPLGTERIWSERLNELWNFPVAGNTTTCLSPTTDWYFTVGVREGKEAVTVIVNAPGFARKDLAVKVRGGTVTVSGKHAYKNEETKGGIKHKEEGYCLFQRSFTLPFPVDWKKARTVHKNGVLEIIIPKPRKT